MTLCREWTLVKHTPGVRYIRPLYCRSWNCEECRPRRKAQLMAQAAAGAPTRFITLTVNPRIGASPAERLRKLSAAWRTAVKRLKRLYPKKPMAYLCVVEETRAGEPHLHILFRGPYLPQKVLSAIMLDLIDSPIVDIRRIRSPKEVVRYIAKYITKAPKQFDGSKRYWCTQDWEAPTDYQDNPVTPPGVSWEIERRNIESILTEWVHYGHVPRRHKGDTIAVFLYSAAWGLTLGQERRTDNYG